MLALGLLLPIPLIIWLIALAHDECCYFVVHLYLTTFQDASSAASFACNIDGKCDCIATASNRDAAILTASTVGATGDLAY